jgi:hypothetical protein
MKKNSSEKKVNGLRHKKRNSTPLNATTKHPIFLLFDFLKEKLPVALKNPIRVISGTSV